MIERRVADTHTQRSAALVIDAPMTFNTTSELDTLGVDSASLALGLMAGSPLSLSDARPIKRTRAALVARSTHAVLAQRPDVRRMGASTAGGRIVGAKARVLGPSRRFGVPPGGGSRPHRGARPSYFRNAHSKNDIRLEV
jgi:hypothetical protein